MSNLSKRAKAVVRTVATLTAVTTVLSLSGFAFVGYVGAVTPADYGLKEGDVVSAAGSDDPDVYIVNEQGYKRLFLSPQIFGLYGHLGGFAAVKNVSPATRDAFPTSGLFRVDGDEKVYGLETTGEDVANLRWVNTSGAQAVADDPNFFKKVFVINAAEKALYGTGADFTSVNQVPAYARGGSVPVATGPLSVSLAPDNPGAKSVTKKALGLAYLKLRLTGSGTLANLTLTRGGAGAVADFDNVYIYDGVNRLTSGKTISSATSKLTFVGLNIAVNGTKDLEVVADMNGVAGNVNSLSVLSASDVVLSSGTVNGAFPLTGSNMTLAGTNGGTFDVTKTGSVANPNIGQKGVRLSEFQLTTNTEGGTVKRLRMIQGGTVKDADLTNIAVKVGGTQVATGFMSGTGYMVLDFGSGYFIPKGDNRRFEIFGDVSGRKDETVKLYFEFAGDVLIVGDQFGFGMGAGTTGIGPLDTSTEAHSLTLLGGVLTLAFNGPSASNIADKSQDVQLLKYSVTAAKGVELRKHTIVMCADIGGDGTFDDITGDFGDVDDIKIKNADTGITLVGPGDGSTFTTQETTASCPNSKKGVKRTFTDTFEVATGQTLNLAITGDIRTSNTSNASSALSNNSVIRAVIDGYGDAVGTAGDLTIAKYTGLTTNTAVTSADFSPSSDMSGNNQTVTTSSLTLGLAAAPTSITYIKGIPAVDLAGFTFKAALGSSLKVTDVTLTGYVSDDNATFAKSKSLAAPDATLSVNNLVSTVRLYDGDTGALLSATPAANNLNTSTSTVVFNNLTWVIPAGAQKRLLVKGDLSSNNPSGSFDGVSLDIAATGDVTGVDDFGTTVNAGSGAPNGGTSPTVKAKIADVGSMNLSLSPSTPIKEAKYWGQSGAEYSRFRLNANDEAFLVERLIFDTKDVAADLTNNVKGLSVTYTNKAGQLVTATGTINSAGSASFGFAGDQRPYVPKDSNIDIIVKADMKTKAEQATSGKQFSVDLSDTFNGSNTDGFRAVGEGSGTVLDGASANINDVAGNNMIVYRVFPKFDQVAVTAGETLGTKDVLKFTITAMGLGDSKLLFDNQAAGSGSIKFEVVASGQANQALTVKAYKVSTGQALDNNVATTGNLQAPSPRASLTIDFADLDLEISGGQSETVRLEVAFGSFLDKSDFFQAVLQDDEDGLVNWVDSSTGATSDADTASTKTFLRLLPMNGPIFSHL